MILRVLGWVFQFGVAREEDLERARVEEERDMEELRRARETMDRVAREDGGGETWPG